MRQDLPYAGSHSSLLPCFTDFVSDMSHAYRPSSAGDASHGMRGDLVNGGGVGAYMAGADRFCARANTPHSYGEINR